MGRALCRDSQLLSLLLHSLLFQILILFASLLAVSRCGDFQQSGAPNMNPKCRALNIRTPKWDPPIFGNSHI